MRVIGIVGAKGGVGKTTVTANLGAALVEHGKRVAVVDCNLTNPHLGLLLGLPASWPVKLNDVLAGRARLEKAVVRHPSGLLVVPAAFEVRDLRSLNLYRLRSRLRAAFSGLDYVLLDSSPGLSAEGLLVLQLCDEIYFVATPHLPAVIDIAKTRRLVRAKVSGVILNRVRGKRYELRDDEIEHFTRLPIAARIPEDEDVLKAANFKAPVVTSQPRARSSEAFRSFAQQIAKAKAKKQKRSFWDFLRR